jgi:hypothetical protein
MKDSKIKEEDFDMTGAAFAGVTIGMLDHYEAGSSTTASALLKKEKRFE